MVHLKMCIYLNIIKPLEIYMDEKTQTHYQIYLLNEAFVISFLFASL